MFLGVNYSDKPEMVMAPDEKLFYMFIEILYRHAWCQSSINKSWSGSWIFKQMAIQ